VLRQYDRSHSISCIVIREGQRRQVEASQLVIGDIVVLQAGHIVPADMRITSSEALEVDGSLFTGESLPRRVHAQPASSQFSYLTAHNTVLLGTTVAQGEGRGMVIATGGRTQLAKISQDCGTAKTSTALHKEMHRLVAIITGFVLLCVAFVVVYWALCRQNHAFPISITRMILYLAPVMLATVPVSLQLSISLGMALVCRRLTRLNVLPKEAGNMITLGAVTTALFDKTGILTLNRADVVAVLTAMNVTRASAEEEVEEEETKD
jgi:magnesium-transporting ATPase (P-type)